MSNQDNLNKKTRFTSKVRIDPKQVEWLKDNKNNYDCSTIAGFVDKIINNFKDEDSNI